jgi:hypothetical protein
VLSGCHGRQLDDRIIAQRRDCFQAHVAAALHRPFIVLLEQQCADEARDGRLVGEDADYISAPLDLAVEESSEALSPKSNIAPCEKPDSMGLSRVVEIDTTGGPEFGLQHLRGYDFLRDKEVVLTFDDGRHPVNTIAVLKALQDECLKATFFEIGKNASWHPEITKELIDAGMTIGTHTWLHKDLARKPYTTDLEKAAQEIEMGASAVHMAAAGAPVAPFFRFPFG